MNSMFSWPKLLRTCALLAFTAGAVMQEMSPRSALYQAVENAGELELSNITYASARFNYRNYGPFGDVDPRSLVMAPEQSKSGLYAPEVAFQQDHGCTPTIDVSLSETAIATISVSSPCTAFTKISAHHLGLAVTEQSDAFGQARLQMPVLAPTAVIFIDVGSTHMFTKLVSTNYLNSVSRTVLTWSGSEDLGIDSQIGQTHTLANIKLIDSAATENAHAFDVSVVSPTTSTCNHGVEFALLRAEPSKSVTVRDFRVAPDVCEPNHTTIQLKSIY